jgi:predicted dehydrogenase
VVAGRLDDRPAASVDALRRHVESGGSLLLAPADGDEAAAELAGARPANDLGATEWFVTLTDRPEAARLEREVPVSSPLRTLVPSAGTEVAATTSVRFAHHPTLTVRSLGAGRVVACGMADLAAVLEHPVLGPYVHRLARAGSIPAARTLGVAVVGYGPYGGMGFAHGLACRETDGLELVAAVDPVAARLDAAEQDFPGLRRYASAEACADDVAIVATPPAHHADLAVALLRAGKHVVVEKPMALTAADADRMIAVAAEHERVLTVHQSRRWDTDWLALHRAVDAGLLGEIFNVETFVGGFEHPCRAWHSEESVSGGAVFDWGSHHVDWILHLMGGPPAQVQALAHKRVWLDVTNADQISVWMRWADGREATFRQSDVTARRRPKFHVQGTAGTLEGWYRPLRQERVEPGRGYVGASSHHAEAPVPLLLTRYEAGYGLVEQVLPPAPHPGWAFHRNLADHLLLGEALAVPPAESRDVVAVLEAAHRSAATGAAVMEV